LDHDKTLQARLDASGYHTAIFGKFLNGFVGDPPHFDRWFTSDDPQTYLDDIYNDQGTIREIPGYSTKVLKNAALDHLMSLEKRDHRPWFTILAPEAPHHPYRPAARDRDLRVEPWEGNPPVFETDRQDKPPYVQNRSTTLKAARKVRGDQLRTLVSVDRMVARIDELLKHLKERGNTLVFFLSDNGYTWGDHGLLGVRYSKNTPYSASVKIPLFMRWPAQIEPMTTRRFVTNVDLAPTIYDATNVKPGYRIDGRSLLKRNWQRNFVFLEHFVSDTHPALPTWRSVRAKDHQYIEYYDSAGEVTFREYYDLKADRWQLENLLGDIDPANDPDTAGKHDLIERLATCRGTQGSNPCP
jgi:arylsulfatase A-like enzyme